MISKLINRKIKTSLKMGLKVIFCIGETLQEKRKKITKKILTKQIYYKMKYVLLKVYICKKLLAAIYG